MSYCLDCENVQVIYCHIKTGYFELQIQFDFTNDKNHLAFAVTTWKLSW